MANITLAIPEELHRKMRKHKDLRWSSLVRSVIEKKINDLEAMDRLLAKSRLTEKDALEISEKIKKAVAKRLGFAR